MEVEIKGLDSDLNTVVFTTNPHPVTGEVKEISTTTDVVKPSELLFALLDDKDAATRPSGIEYEKYHLLQACIQFMEHFVNVSKSEPLNLPKPLLEHRPKDTWYWEFIDKYSEPETLIDLLRVSNYLGITELLNLAAAKMSTLLKGKTPDEIRSMLKTDRKP
jgi:S-phase kinase-associated protein 1